MFLIVIESSNEMIFVVCSSYPLIVQIIRIRHSVKSKTYNVTGEALVPSDINGNPSIECRLD